MFNLFIKMLAGYLMKTQIFAILSIIFFIALTACDGKPVANFKETTHDFGKVKISTTVTHTFHFTNTGTSTLVIERVKAG